MKKVYSAPNSPQCHILKSVLESNDIPCIVKNENLAGLAGRVPFGETWPELWVLDDDQYDQASQILKETTEKNSKSVKPNKAVWACPSTRTIPLGLVVIGLALAHLAVELRQRGLNLITTSLFILLLAIFGCFLVAKAAIYRENKLATNKRMNADQ